MKIKRIKNSDKADVIVKEGNGIAYVEVRMNKNLEKYIDNFLKRKKQVSI